MEELDIREGTALPATTRSPCGRPPRSVFFFYPHSLLFATRAGVIPKRARNARERGICFTSLARRKSGSLAALGMTSALGRLGKRDTPAPIRNEGTEVPV